MITAIDERFQKTPKPMSSNWDHHFSGLSKPRRNREEITGKYTKIESSTAPLISSDLILKRRNYDYLTSDYAP
jgi:hypothetical protein